MEFTGSILFADESSWLTLTTDSDDEVTVKVSFTQINGGETVALTFAVTPNSGVVRLPAGEILRALIDGGGSAVSGYFQATQGDSSCTHSFKVFPCRKFSYTSLYTAVFCTRPTESPAYEGGKDTLSFYNSTYGSTSAYVRFRYSGGGVSSDYSLYVPVNTRAAAMYTLDVSRDTMLSVAAAKGLATDSIAGYDVWIVYSGSKSDTYSFEVCGRRLPLKTYKFLGRRGTYEYIHATGKFSRSAESETRVFVNSGIEEELENDSVMTFEQNTGHVGSVGMAGYWLEFLASKERYIVEKDGSERRIVVDEHKTALSDREVGSVTFKWHYANPDNTVIDKAEVALTGLTVTGEATVSSDGNTAQYGVIYSPSNTTQRGVTWSVVSGADYASIDQNGLLTVLAGASGSSVKIRATSRDNTAVYAEKSLTVTYYAKTVPTWSLASSMTLDPEGGTVTILVTDPDGKGWQVLASSWLTLKSGSLSGTGSGTLTLAYEAYTGGSSRTGSVTLRSEGGNVASCAAFQSAIQTPVALTGLAIESDNVADGKVSGGGVFKAVYTPSDTTQKGVVWSIVSGADYATIDSGGSTGECTVLFSDDESAVGQTVTIRCASTENAAIHADITVTIEESAVADWSVTGATALDGTAGATSQYGIDWGDVAEDEVTWSLTGATASDGTSYAGISSGGLLTLGSVWGTSAAPSSAVIGVVATSGSGESRTLEVTITKASGETSDPTWDLASALTLDPAGGTVTINVSNPDGKDWTVGFNTWMTLQSGAQGGTGDGSLTISYPANDTGAAREGIIILRGRSDILARCTVTQAASSSDAKANPTWALGATETKAANTSGFYPTVTDADGVGWSLASDAEWISVQYNSVVGQLGFEWDTNTTGTERSGTVRLVSADGSTTFASCVITQEGGVAS